VQVELALIVKRLIACRSRIYRGTGTYPDDLAAALQRAELMPAPRRRFCGREWRRWDRPSRRTSSRLLCGPFESVSSGKLSFILSEP
jgi:hypothetical protein